MSPRLTLLVAALLSSTVLTAQPRARINPDVRKGVVTLNPFALFAEYLGGDVEVKASPSFTVGGGVSYTGIDDFNDYFALEGKVRYYPGEKALQGFSVAGTAGLASARDEIYDGSGNRLNGQRRSRPTIGTELSYQWILGPAARFVAVTGLGLKRYYGAEGRSDPLNATILPTARINIGYAF